MFWCLFWGVFAQCTMREWVFLDVTFMICAWQSGHHHSWFIYVSASIQWALCLKIIWKLKLLCVTSSFLSCVWYGGFITPPALHQQWLSIVFLMNSKTMTGKGVIALRKIFFTVRVWIMSLGEFENLTGGDPEQLDWMLDLFQLVWAPHLSDASTLHPPVAESRRCCCGFQWISSMTDSFPVFSLLLGAIFTFSSSGSSWTVSHVEKLLYKVGNSSLGSVCVGQAQGFCSLSFRGITRHFLWSQLLSILTSPVRWERSIYKIFKYLAERSSAPAWLINPRITPAIHFYLW